MYRKSMLLLLMSLAAAAILAAGCGDGAETPEEPTKPTPATKPAPVVTFGEPERKASVQALIEQLADESLENRQAAYAELRDTFVRKRDIPDLTKEIARNANGEVTMSLRKLITFMEGRRWRLPDKGWTTDIDECSRRYQKEFHSHPITRSILTGRVI